MRRLSLLFALALLAVSAGARTDGGSSAAEFLRISPSARGAARGDAMTAGAEGVAALHYNPAGLGYLRRAEAEAMYQHLTLDVGHGALGAALPWGDASGWGVSATYIDYGEAFRTTISMAGGAVAISNAGTFSGSDLAVGFSYGHRFGDWAIGVTARGISSHIDDASAAAVAADVGILWRHPTRPYSVGVAGKNLGSRIRFDRDREDLPALVRAGAHAGFRDETIRLSVEVEKAREENVRFLGGVEVWPSRNFALRAGYDGRLEIAEGFTGGVGFHSGDLSLDYAYIPFGKAGDNHRFGVRYDFGPARGGGGVTEEGASKPGRRGERK